MPTGRARALAADGYCLIAHGRARTDKPLVPHRRQGRTIYPVGTFATALCWPEWQLLLDNGADVEIEEAAWYEPVAACERFQRVLYDYRCRCEREGRRAKATCVKRLANSLIGKFAAWDWSWQDYPSVGIGEPFATWYETPSDGDKPVRWRSIGWHTQKEVFNGENADSLPAISAYVYARGRVAMQTWLSACAPGKVYYVDTDGLFVDQLAYECLARAGYIRENELGGLSLRKIHAWLTVDGLKLYRTPDGIVAAGLSDNHQLVTEGGWEFWRPERVTDTAREGRAPDAKLLRYQVPFKRQYLHGAVDSAGNVTPFRLGE